LDNIGERVGVGGDPLSVVQRVEVRVQVKPRGRVERLHLGPIRGVGELHAVIDAGVPREVAACSELQLEAAEEPEQKVGVVVPFELVELLGCIVGSRGLRARGIEPTGNIRQRGGKRNPRLALRRLLRSCERGGRRPEVGPCVAEAREVH